jgi:hypothetical protein
VWHTKDVIPDQYCDLLIETKRGFIVGYYNMFEQFRYDTELLEYDMNDDSGFYFRDTLSDVIRWAYINDLKGV